MITSKKLLLIVRLGLDYNSPNKSKHKDHSKSNQDKLRTPKNVLSKEKKTVAETDSLYPPPSSPSPSVDQIAKKNFTGGVAQPNATDPAKKLADSLTKNPINPESLKR